MCDHANDPGGREAAMTVIAPGVWCDPCLAPIVRALNASDLPRIPTKDGPDGIATVVSCCGHGKALPRITLADGREIVIYPDCESGCHAAISTEPAVVTSVDELEALPVGTAFRDECGLLREVLVRSDLRGAPRWYDGPQVSEGFEASDVPLPATVLTPTQPRVPVSRERIQGEISHHIAVVVGWAQLGNEEVNGRSIHEHFTERTYRAADAILALLTPTPREVPAVSDDRLPECVERWPGAVDGEYDPRCCRFPKSCSAGSWSANVPVEGGA